MPKTITKKKYRTVSLQEDLINKIEELLGKNVGYNTLADFVSDAIRRRLEELEKIQLVAEEYELSEEDVKRMAHMRHINIAVNGGRTVIAVEDETDGRIYDVYLSQSPRGQIRIFCDGDKSFDCPHVKYVRYIIIPKLNELIDMYRKKKEE